MFGDDPADGPSIKVCCGPRCGVAPHHRAIYEAIERTAQTAPTRVLPTMCQGLCHGGVTVVWPDGRKAKIQETREAAALTAAALSTSSPR